MNDVPRPRILFEDVPDDDLLSELVRFAGTYGVLGVDVQAIHPSDWDLVVSFHKHPEEPDGVHVLSFGGATFGEVAFDEVAGRVLLLEPVRNVALHARTTLPAVGLPPALRSLVERSIVASDPGPGRVGLSSMPHGHMPLAVVGAEESAWAAKFARDGTHIWALPAETTAHVDWLVHVLQVLHDVDSERFPGRPDWQKSSRWGSPEMREAIADLEEVEAERSRVVAGLDARAAAADERLRVASELAVGGPQRVLTEQGEQLEQAVQHLLGDLGFEVDHMDAYHETNSGGRLEDLRVSPPGGGWTCLVEIKGYASGAKVNDITKVLGRPSTVYAAREGREPDAVWHVVNAWRGKDPATREVAIPQGLDLIDLTDARGCLIDTRDLFRAWRDVQEGHAQSGSVRASLMEARTRWTWQGEG